MQKAIFPLRYTWQSQGMNGATSHKDIKAIDFGILSPYNDDKLYAPFDGKVVWVDSPSKGGGIAFQSINKVHYVNGKEDYMTLFTGHDNNPPKVGTIFKQGELYSHSGTAGGVPKHCHLEVQIGKFVKPTKVTSQGSYKLDNAIEPFNALYLTEDTILKYSTYTWTTLPEIDVTPVVPRDESINQIKVLVQKLRVRSEHSTSATPIGYAVENGIYNMLDSYKDDKYTWYKIADNQWVANDGTWIEELPTTNYKELYEKEKAINENLQKENDNLKLKLKQINELSK